ncbi:hypothetical protein VTP01DRAFT_8648 [Rhizomucor pusillus]|uniref:uncharacterized protein n=1 Tax=Rhizomucor pusillus TaxID=4840 RepID=UPI00374484E3
MIRRPPTLPRWQSALYSTPIRRTQIAPLRFQTYSSLRRPRQYGPRGRILNHVESLRPATAQKPTIPQREPVQPNNITVEEDQHFAANPAETQVDIPQPTAGAVVTPDYHGAPLLSQSALVVGREFEMLNIFLGFEQANRYKIMDPHGNYVGYIAEEEGFMKSLSRQFLRTHRPLKATILDAHGNVIFKIERPFAFINSRIFIYTEDDRLIGEVQQRWHLLRRKYDLFVGNTQFAYIDTPFLGWDFYLQDEDGGVLGNVSRNFTGFAREIFTDTGQYVLRMDAVEGNKRGLTLDERAVTLACAISIDFDYFSRHSQHGGGGFMPIPFFGLGESHEESHSNNEQEYPTNPTDQNTQQSDAPWANDNSKDPWMSDEEAGVRSPMDDLKGFFGGFGDEDEEDW